MSGRPRRYSAMCWASGLLRRQGQPIRSHAAAFGLDVQERRDLAMLAVQGPEARARLAELLTPPDAQTALALAASRCCYGPPTHH